MEKLQEILLLNKVQKLSCLLILLTSFASNTASAEESPSYADTVSWIIERTTKVSQEIDSSTGDNRLSFPRRCHLVNNRITSRNGQIRNHEIYSVDLKDLDPDRVLDDQFENALLLGSRSYRNVVDREIIVSEKLPLGIFERNNGIIVRPSNSNLVPQLKRAFEHIISLCGDDLF